MPTHTPPKTPSTAGTVNKARLSTSLAGAFHQREDFFEQCEAEQTNAYRLFHGTVEGCPGLTLDRYGDHLLAQSFHHSLDEGQLDDILQFCQRHFQTLPLFYNDRSDRHSQIRHADELTWTTAEQQEEHRANANQHECIELGARYRVTPRHRGADPLLFLDFRSTRRQLLHNSKNLSVLNTFAYTCGAGLCAAIGGASEVVNLDFAQSSLDYGRENRELNNLSPESVELVKSDYFMAMSQYSGSALPGRRGRKNPPRQPASPLSERSFDLIVLDPPRWAKSKFGTVDLVRDYQSVFKPCLKILNPDGQIICTNNVAKVPLDEWLDLLKRCSGKFGRTIQDIELLQPDSDFPSPDNKPPLKIAILRF